MKKCNLSLTEILVVVGIIILLFTIGVPAVIKGMQRGELTECKGNLRQLSQATSVFLKDNKNYFPLETSGDWIGSTNDPISEYLGGSLTSTNTCPSDPSEANSYRASADGDDSGSDLDLAEKLTNGEVASKRGQKLSNIKRPDKMSLFISKEVYDNLDGAVGETWHGTDAKAVFPFVSVGGSVQSLTFNDDDLDINDEADVDDVTYQSSTNASSRIDFKNY